MRRDDLIRKIRRAAAGKGHAFESVTGTGRGPHEKWQCSGVKVAIPRHREINDYTARQIMKDLEGVLGKEWWR